VLKTVGDHLNENKVSNIKEEIELPYMVDIDYVQELFKWMNPFMMVKDERYINRNHPVSL